MMVCARPEHPYRNAGVDWQPMMHKARPSGVRERSGGARARILRSGLALGMILLSSGLMLTATGKGAWPTQAATVANLRGTILDAASGVAIGGATIIAADLGVSATSDADGRFSVPDIPVSQLVTTATFTVSASGYGDWTLMDARLVAGDTLILKAELKNSPVTIRIPSRQALEANRASLSSQLVSPLNLSAPAEDQTNAPLPETIRVRVTGYAYCDTGRPYTVETLDFKDYAKHVLPMEWPYNWIGESLRAGGMAVKMYAWSIIAAGGKYADADVYDSTCDQVYNPAVEYQSTNDAVDFTWNWRMTWVSTQTLVRAFYRAQAYQCPSELVGACMGQVESNTLAGNRYTWDEILAYFYTNNGGIDLTPVWDPPGGYSLRFEGNGYGNLDRVNIKLDGPPRPIDVGDDFTIEWWMKATPGENGTAACTSGDGAWLSGNTLLDRDISGPGDHGEYGISLMNGRLAFGVNNGTTGFTLCGAANLANGAWHHVVVQRQSSGGQLQIFIDGALDAQAVGPTGDLSYRDNRTPAASRDPYLVVGAEKFDTNKSLYPSFLGWITEIRISNVLRYSGPYPTPSARFAADGATVGLYHFGQGYGDPIHDTSGASGGPSDGLREYGGVINGPEWTYESPWYVAPPTPTPTPYTLFLPLIQQDESSASSSSPYGAQPAGTTGSAVSPAATPTPTPGETP